MSDRASSSPEPAPKTAPDPNTQQNPKDVGTQVEVKEESPSPPSPTTTNPQQLSGPSSSPTRWIRRTTAQKRAYFRDDPQCGELEPHRVYCNGCAKWIRLSSISQYALNNWQIHKKRCTPSSPSRRTLRRTPTKPMFSPSGRVATAERKIILLNDPQVRSFSATHAHCGTCKTEVAFEGAVDFDLTKWVEHKEKCIPVTAAPITPRGSRSQTNPPRSTSSAHSQGSAGRARRSATPVGEGNSTEATAVGESPESPGEVKVSVKRGRDEETDEVEVAKAVDVRPTNRPRTETYQRPEQDPQSLFGWLMQPLKEFARGFREGLGTT